MNSRRLMLDPKISGERIIATKPTVLIGAEPASLLGDAREQLAMVTRWRSPTRRRTPTLRVAPHRYATLEPLGKPGGSQWASWPIVDRAKV